MADWAKTLGLSLGGDSEAAYQEGRYMGAKTEDALAQARERVEKNAARARLQTDLEASGLPANISRAASTALAAGGGIDDPLEALLKNQTFGFNRDIADPNVPLDTAQRMVLAKSTSPVEPLYKVGGGYGNKFDSAAGLTPLGDSAGGDGGGSSAFMQAARAFGVMDANGNIDPTKRALAYEILRNTDKLFDVGGVPTIRSGNPFAGGPPAAPGAAAPAPTAPATAAPTALAPVDQVTGNTAAIASAKEQGQAIGRNAAGLESTNATIDKFVQDIDRFLGQPGFDALYGNLQGTDIGKMVGGVLDQDIANARADFDTLGGEAFLASIQKMRGFGQLSNQEGLKVQTALTRALDSRIGSPEARAAWAEVKKHMAELKRVAAIEAGRDASAGAQPKPAAPAAAGERKSVGGKNYVKVNGQWFEDDGT